MPLVEDPDVEQLLVNYLAPALISAGYTVPVSDRKTAPECVVVYTVGGGPRRDRVIGAPSVVVETYSTLNSRASAIQRRAHALLLDLEGQALGATLVYGVQEFRSPTSDPRPPDEIRYSSMVSILLSLTRVA